MNRTLRTPALAPIFCMLLFCLLISGCRVSEHKNGDHDNVDIGTPFGSMHVNTNDSGETSAIGLAAYPGAVPIKDDDDKGGGSADVNMSFGSFHLGVKAASFQTPDSQAKVLAFYRKDLASRYGTVIECDHDKPVGTPTRTSQGLTCDSSKGTHIRTSDGHSKGFAIMSGSNSGENTELRAGSERHQHIVGVEAHDGGTKIGLVALDLPSAAADHDRSDSE